MLLEAKESRVSRGSIECVGCSAKERKDKAEAVGVKLCSGE